MSEEENFFTFAVNEDGHIEPVVWFKTLEEARREARKWKRAYPEGAKQVFVGQRLKP